MLAISKAGELAVSLNRHPQHAFVRTGRLARISIAGGAPRDILDDVQYADWSPDGQSLAIVRDVGIKNRLEYPIGKVLFETTGWVGQVRVSPKDDVVAFVDHPFQNDDGGRVALVDKAGKKTNLTPIYATVQGLVWTPDGGEIWYTAAEGGFNRAVHAVTKSGKTRLVGRVPGISTIRDISKDGHVLMTNESARLGVLERGPGDDKDRELSWLDYSLVTDVSPDGQKMLITESGEGGRARLLRVSAQDRRLSGDPARGGVHRGVFSRRGLGDLHHRAGIAPDRAPAHERRRAEGPVARGHGSHQRGLSCRTARRSSTPRPSPARECGSICGTSRAGSRAR